ncbi:YodC family protein [Brevundimonas sp. SL161]|uniref:YodC family protein n=1 Tax=Brevundimonas sp. SL161 TaxID=2804613 RepID=UPI003CEBD895
MGDELVVGDVARLKSGGPVMTVTTVAEQYGTPMIWTMWFDQKGSQNGTFPPAALQKEEDE